MEQRPSALFRIAAPLKSLVQRFMYLGLIAAAFGLMLLGKVDAVLVDRVRAEVTDVVAPILEALSRPVATVSKGIQNFQELVVIREENAILKQQNARLMQWQTVARKLQAENTALQNLLGVVHDKNANYVSARVIAGSDGAFANMLIVNAGENDGVRKGQAVISDRGIIGRISEVSNRSARVLLLTDINSRIPVLIENNRTRAIMTGTNTSRTKLIHLPPGAHVTPSDRIITSGHGGAFPSGLPVGVVASVSDGGIEVQLFADYAKLEFVRIADFGLKGLVDMSVQKNSAKHKAGGRTGKK
ncbi:MAG: rod shape-determining protein MreC [Rhodospirillales bacterium]|nr:rod shape-determining protein MreC [Rhodospirillales bacterium]